MPQEAARDVPLDTARGLLRKVGSDPQRLLVLTPTLGAPLALSTADSSSHAQLVAAVGLEIMVEGQRSAERNMEAAPGGAAVFVVRRFVVRAADGVPARDGMLRRDGNNWILELANGVRQPIVGLPSALQTQDGARVFLVGVASQTPQAYGVLRPSAPPP